MGLSHYAKGVQKTASFPPINISLGDILGGSSPILRGLSSRAHREREREYLGRKVSGNYHN